MPKKKRRLKPLGPMPELRESLASVAESAAWVHRAVAEEVISSSQSREMISSGRLMIAVIRTTAGLHEIENLRQLVARKEAAARMVQQAAIASRHSQTDDVSEYPADEIPDVPGTN